MSLLCAAAIASSASAQPAAQPAAVPQQRALSPEEAAALDRLLAAWETRNASVKTWSCGF